MSHSALAWHYRAKGVTMKKRFTEEQMIAALTIVRMNRVAGATESA